MNKKINYKAKEKISMVEESAYTRGPESLSDIDILSLIIGNKNKAQELLEAAGSMRQLRVWTHDQLLEFKGIGKKLLTWLEQKAQQKGYKIIWLDTMDEQPQAFEFYKKQGYKYHSHCFLEFDLLYDHVRKMSQVYKNLND